MNPEELHMTPEEMDKYMGSEPSKIYGDGRRAYVVPMIDGRLRMTILYPNGHKETLKLSPTPSPNSFEARLAEEFSPFPKKNVQADERSVPKETSHALPHSKTLIPWLALCCAGFLFFALASSLPYSYFTLLRFIVCFTSIVVCVWSADKKIEWFKWTHCIVILLFNPVLKFHLGRNLWSIMDLVTGCFMIFTAFYIWKKSARIN